MVVVVVAARLVPRLLAPQRRQALGVAAGAAAEAIALTALPPIVLLAPQRIAAAVEAVPSAARLMAVVVLRGPAISLNT